MRSVKSFTTCMAAAIELLVESVQRVRDLDDKARIMSPPKQLDGARDPVFYSARLVLHALRESRQIAVKIGSGRLLIHEGGVAALLWLWLFRGSLLGQDAPSESLGRLAGSFSGRKSAARDAGFTLCRGLFGSDFSGHE